MLDFLKETQPTVDTGQKVTCADVVRGVRDKSSRMRDSLTGRIEGPKRTLQRRTFSTETTPITTALYFEDDRRRSIGPIRQGLRNAFRRGCFLGRVL